jgi:hypothetical protein
MAARHVFRQSSAAVRSGALSKKSEPKFATVAAFFLTLARWEREQEAAVAQILEDGPPNPALNIRVRQQSVLLLTAEEEGEFSDAKVATTLFNLCSNRLFGMNSERPGFRGH